MPEFEIVSPNDSVIPKLAFFTSGPMELALTGFLGYGELSLHLNSSSDREDAKRESKFKSHCRFT